jgi:hypothetical protein
MSRMAIGAWDPPVVRNMGIGFELLCPLSDGCVTGVAFQTRFAVRDGGWSPISMAVLAGEAQPSVYIFNVWGLLGDSPGR